MIYKCVVTNTGYKMYYKQVNNKWVRITDKEGIAAEKGKKKYKGLFDDDEKCPICYKSMDETTQTYCGFCMKMAHTSHFHEESSFCLWCVRDLWKIVCK